VSDVLLRVVHVMHHVVHMVMVMMDGRGLGGDREGESGNEREGGEETHVEGSLISNLLSLRLGSRSIRLRS
jgi:hypothetical protein